MKHGIAEELADKHTQGLAKQYGNYPVRVEMIQAINAALERAAQECDTKSDEELNEWHYKYSVIGRILAERIRALKSE